MTRGVLELFDVKEALSSAIRRQVARFGGGPVPVRRIFWDCLSIFRSGRIRCRLEGGDDGLGFGGRWGIYQAEEVESSELRVETVSVVSRLWLVVSGSWSVDETRVTGTVEL